MVTGKDANILCKAVPFAALLFLLGLSSAVCADDAAAKSDGGEKYLLRYKFQPGESLHWKVVQRVRVRTTVASSTQTAETTSISEKVWQVKDVKPDGAATFEHMVQWVDMRQKLTGRNEVHYDSRTDPAPPQGFENLAQSVGIPLSIITLDAKGKISERKRNTTAKAAAAGDGEITIPLPAEPVAVGYAWSSPHDIELPLPGGGTITIKSRQTYAIESVKTGVATIRLATQILTPLHDPAIEAQLIQYQSAGTVRFDIDAGRIIGQQMDVDKGVVGFRGEASSIHYLTRFTEEFQGAEAFVAERPAKNR